MTSSGDEALAVGDVIGQLGLSSLRASYASGELSPEQVIRVVYGRIRDRGQDNVWITLVPEALAVEAARRLERNDLARLPLWGIPFGVKDNIDVAGVQTTAGCPGFGYLPQRSAVVVDKLLAAGAILIGKTNLDQFATGLNGTRSPYGVPLSTIDPALIPGGSSSGSGVAVAADLVTFTLGTDTAGSGRVPAALTGIVGVKPSLGLVSTSGVVPACRSLDCPSVFATTIADAATVVQVAAGVDPLDPWSRELPFHRPAPMQLAGLRLAVPSSIQGWGSRGEEQAWLLFLDRLIAAGVDLVAIDLAPFLEAGRELYQGPWLAERLEGLESLVAEHPELVLDVTREILAGGLRVTGLETFAGINRMRELRLTAYNALAEVDALLTPTVTETFTVAQMLADPIELNARLGTYTAFTNLLDLCAVALPAGVTSCGVPFGVTLQSTSGRDGAVLALAAAIEGDGVGQAHGQWVADSESDFELAVVGAHLRGLPLHHQLLARDAQLVQRTMTAPTYRLYALADSTPPKPGLRRVSTEGASIEVEVYRLPRAQVGAFLAEVPAPLGIGRVTLADGSEVHGFVCEEFGLAGGTDITEHRGWRGYLSSIGS
jgi:allophanate hydrolase